LDVIAGNEMVIDYMIKKMGLHGKFRKAYYRFVIKEMEYFAFSKKSPHFKRLPEINQILQEMKKSGKIQEYIDHYTRN
jgi:ABC-type amino acid transport substrate-binding protein